MNDTITEDIHKRLLTPEEAGQYINASAWTVRQMVRSGQLPYIPRGRKIFLDVEDLGAYVERRKVRDVY